MCVLFVGVASCDGCKNAPPPAHESYAMRGGPPRDGLPAIDKGSVPIKIHCANRIAAIDPHLFGVGFADESADLGARAHRWGGNTTSRYNFKLGNAWSTGSDWFYRNVEIDPLEKLIAKAHALRGADAWVAVTVPMIGWVAKDTQSGSFPVSRFGQQKKTAPERPDLGNGLDSNGKPIAPGEPTIASVAIGPADVGAWVERIQREDTDHIVKEYILDNEPSLWSHTHRDVHPEPETYDELLEKTLAYARAIRKAAPDAIIAGPAEWGWPGYFYSGKDAETSLKLRTDRRLHGDVPKLIWYMRALAAEEKRTGEKLVDVIDLHFYPQADGVQRNDGDGDGGGDTDPATNARRLRSTRALWDDDYVDESYVNLAISLIPRIRAVIKEEHPRLGLQIGEFNFGGESDMSGGLALAEVLGRMAEGGVSHAFYWKAPKPASPAFFAMRAFCNYDGAGSSFSGDVVQTEVQVGLSAFAALRKGDGRLVVELLNFDDKEPRDIAMTLDGCGERFEMRRYEYESTKAPIRFSHESLNKTTWQGIAAKSSINVLEMVRVRTGE
jgi:hypothetical protein